MRFQFADKVHPRLRWLIRFCAGLADHQVAVFGVYAQRKAKGCRGGSTQSRGSDPIVVDPGPAGGEALGETPVALRAPSVSPGVSLNTLFPTAFIHLCLPALYSKL